VFRRARSEAGPAAVGPAGAKSRRLAEQALIRVRTRLTAWYQKLHRLQEIAEKLFKPWVSERLRVDGLFR